MPKLYTPSLLLLRALRASTELRIPSKSMFQPKYQRSRLHFLSASSKRIHQTRLVYSKASSDRGPTSKEDTQTDFTSMNVLGNTPPPTTSIDACLSDGFHLDNGLKIGGGSGCLLVAGEAFSWRPWDAGTRESGEGKRRMINRKGQWNVEREAWGLLDVVWPKPGESELLDLFVQVLGERVT